MPRNWIEDWTRWLSSLGVLCLLGVPGMLFPVTEAPSGEEVPAPNPSPVEAPASENSSDNQGEQGLNPNVLVVAAKHDQIVPRRAASADERPCIRPVSQRDTGTLRPNLPDSKSDTGYGASLLRMQRQVEARLAARQTMVPRSICSHFRPDPAVGTVVCVLAPPMLG